MSRLRWTLVALLVASTVLFAAGVIAERSGTDPHAEPAAARATDETGGEAAEPEGAHDEGTESSATGSGEAAHAESAAEADESEQLLGVDVESTPLVVLAVLAGLTLAAVAATRFGAMRGFLLAVAVVALAWAALDVREVIHQLDESRTDVAVIAMAVTALHLAVAAISGRLASQAPATP
jgi:hypothetical protein